MALKMYGWHCRYVQVCVLTECSTTVKQAHRAATMRFRNCHSTEPCTRFDVDSCPASYVAMLSWYQSGSCHRHVTRTSKSVLICHQCSLASDASLPVSGSIWCKLQRSMRRSINATLVPAGSSRSMRHSTNVKLLVERRSTWRSVRRRTRSAIATSSGRGGARATSRSSSISSTARLRSPSSRCGASPVLARYGKTSE